MQPTPDYPMLDNTNLMGPARVLPDGGLAAFFTFVPSFPPQPSLPPPASGADDPVRMGPGVEEGARQYWEDTHPWPSMPVPKQAPPLANKHVARPGENDVDSERATKRQRRTAPASGAFDETARQPSTAYALPPSLLNSFPDTESVLQRVLTALANATHQRPASDVGDGAGPAPLAANEYDAASLASAFLRLATASPPTALSYLSPQPHIVRPEDLLASWHRQLAPLPVVEASGLPTVAPGDLLCPTASPACNTAFAPPRSGGHQRSTVETAYPYPGPQWGGDLSIVADDTDGAHAPRVDLKDAVGLHIQQGNTVLPPRQSQRPQHDADQPVAGSSKMQALDNCQAETGQGRPWEKREKVPFEDSVVGQMCAAHKLSKTTPAPFRCFLRSTHRSKSGKIKAHDTEYGSWDSFVLHLQRCQPEDETLWPRCHFCGKAIPAVRRPFEMDRHIIGGDGKKPCEGLDKLMQSGMTTNGAIGDWLRVKGLRIHTEFLGMWFSEDFYRAAYWKQGREAPVDLAGKRREETKEQNAAKKAAKVTKATKG